MRRGLLTTLTPPFQIKYEKEETEEKEKKTRKAKIP